MRIDTHDKALFLDLTWLLERLRDEGLVIGLDTHLDVQQVLLRLKGEPDVRVWQHSLAALLCKSRHERAVFDTLFVQAIQGEQPQQEEKNTQKQAADSHPTVAPHQPEPDREEMPSKPSWWQRLRNWWDQLWQDPITRRVAQRSSGPRPKDYAVLRSPEPFAIQPNPAIHQLTARLRTRQPMGRPYLDVAQTVRQSIRRLGAFDPVYADRTRATTYLVLIEADHSQDHRAQLYDTFVAQLHERGIACTRYFFRGQPLQLHHPETHQHLSLAQVVQRHTGSICITFAALGVFLRGSDNQPYRWVQHWQDFGQAFLFLPFGQALEARLATPLRDYFTDVMAADERGFARLQQATEAPFGQTLSLRRTVPLFTVPVADAQDLARLPQDFPELLPWIAACAVYPECSWPLTLFLGKSLSPTYNTWDNLQQLARLPWFRQGYIPDDARRYILQQDWLSTKDQERIRAAIRKTQHHTQGTELTRIYDPSSPPDADTIGDYVVAQLIQSRYRDLLLFELDGDEPPPPPATPPRITETIKGVSFEMLYVEGGTFEMGYDRQRDGEDKYMDDAKP
ncbi:MAG: hypothetical protein ACFCUI_13660, partial [Bernardetiaceae bacterium]